jgi:hypothetical protein
MYDVGSGGPQFNILFVDDDVGNTYETYWEASFTNLGYSYDKWVVSDSGDVAPNATQMGGYYIVVWTTGDDWFTSLTPTDTTEIGNYLTAGGCFWLGSQDVLFDIGIVGWMHISDFTNDVHCGTATGIGPVMNGTSFGTTGGVFIDYSDWLEPDNISWTEMTNEYGDPNTIAYDDGGCKFFFSAFGFENINNTADQDTMMERVIQWFMTLPPDHDVGSLVFLSPGPNVSPGAADVIGVVHNFGINPETYDVHCVVNDPTYAIVLDTTINVTTPAGENDTLTFGNLTFVDGYTYDLMMATLLAGDEDPENDTLTQSTLCTPQYWESFTDMPAARSGSFAGWYYDYAGDGATYVHVFGGNPGPSYDHYVWTASTNTWATGTPLPVASNYGGHVTIGDRIYMIGAREGNAGNIVIYDVPSDVYSTVALPGTIGDPAVAVKDDQYIYIIGGCRPSNWIATTIVMLYDCVGDSFCPAVTQLPASDARTCACAAYLDNDTIYVAGGIDSTNANTNEFLAGYVDPANPANITWTVHPMPKPGSAVYRLNGGPVFDDTGNGMFLIAGGDAGGPYVTETYSYTPNSGWATLPNKITGVSNWGRAIAPTDIPDDAEWIMYAAGGYTGEYQAEFEGYHTGIITGTGVQEMPNEQVSVFAFTVTSSNPVTDRATFAFSMPFKGAVNFSVYDVTGRKVVDSKYSNISQGEHTMFWNLKDNAGREVSSGAYFYRVEVGDHHAEGKLVVVR